MLLASGMPCVLVLEDDLIWRHISDLESVLSAIEKSMVSEKPLITLLSGDYWYTSVQNLTGQYKLASVRDAVCTQSYVINRSAAKKLLKLDNWHVADDWWAIKKQGIALAAVLPHLADQNRADVDTVIAEVYGGVIKRNISLKRRLYLLWLSLVKKVLVWCRHFEAKSFKWINGYEEKKQ